MTFAPKTILVPVAVAPGDDLPLAEHLVDVACDLARCAGGRVELVYVEAYGAPVAPLDIGLLPGNALETMIAVRAANREAAQQALGALAERAKRAGVVAAGRFVEANGGVGEAIARVAADLHADLIAVSGHGKRGMRRLLLGSVAERVSHLSPVPVLIVHAA